MKTETPFVHYHMILRFKTTDIIADEDTCKTFIHELASAIDMKILSGPHTVYVPMPGNKGLSSVTVIETSHISFHTWDEQDPMLVQLDIFSCKQFTEEQVLQFLNKRFNITDIEIIFLDRTNALEVR